MKKSYYYTLLIKGNRSNKWRIEFGDFDRETVEEERDITWREGLGCTLKDTKIIKTSESQKEIDAKVAKLNEVKPIVPTKKYGYKEPKIKQVTPVHIAEIKKLQYQIDELKEERDVLARENKSFAEYLERSGFSNDAITSIAFGSDEPELQCQSCEELDYSSLEDNGYQPSNRHLNLYPEDFHSLKTWEEVLQCLGVDDCKEVTVAISGVKHES